MNGYTKSGAKCIKYVEDSPSTIFFLESGYENMFIFVEETPFDLTSKLMTIDEITEKYGLSWEELV